MKLIKNKDKKTIAEIHFLTDKREIKNKEIVKIINITLIKCYKELPLLNKKMAIYHSNDIFIRDKMGGLEPTHWKKI